MNNTTLAGGPCSLFIGSASIGECAIFVCPVVFISFFLSLSLVSL